MRVTFLLGLAAGSASKEGGPDAFGWRPHDDGKDEQMVSGLLAAVENLAGKQVPRSHEAALVKESTSSWGNMFPHESPTPNKVQSLTEPVVAALPEMHAEALTDNLDHSTPSSSWQGFGATRAESTVSEIQTQNSQVESPIAQHMVHEQDQVSNLLGMVAGMAKDEKTKQALLRRQARVESHADSESSNQLLTDAASLGTSVDVVASSVTANHASSTMSEEERREREAVGWQDTGVAQGAMLPATAPHRISGTWRAWSMPSDTVEEPKPKGLWDSSIFDAIGKTASAMGVSSAETATTAAPAKRDSLMAAFMHHSRDVQLHRVDSKKLASSLEKDANLFTDQDAQEMAQERASQEQREVAHEDAAEAALSTRAAPPNSALSRFMGVAPRKQSTPAGDHQMEMKTGSDLDAFTFDDPTPSPEGKHMALASTQSIMSTNLASWLGYESSSRSRPHPHAEVTQRKTNANGYLVDLGLDNAQ